ncbi:MULTISPECIES: ABC transporter permease [Pedobacter]|uniref:ABC transporter permease protein n=1 Tax=Pedobacter heparinus (strain ATCC 13125 / DSM 2366 / CIP 104194 / JCM 7457 / NBRC 12017 / NCIMB 9290 / NRRL B-14731 / HIM 762-3) TaxID=485917 RepID=C6Y1T0_PEDHD|nr:MULTISPECIES: ABC transporter permease subunit [Pedobacter]ACU05072.1 ABC transporter permease protein [Pedobacter heparinus DSM 2366]MBB5437734.1 ABC-2 type transport system permease protein [Pedobacter sp. AK017]
MKSQPLSSPFNVMVHKEMADHIRSWRFIVLMGLIILTFVASMYVSLGNIRSAMSNVNDPDHTFLYLKLLTATDNSMPPFHVFLSFLAPLLGISLGFDAINAEQNSGTLTRLIAQPVYRDNLLLAKFVSALILVSAPFLVLALLMIGGGLVLTGVRIEPQELLRILGFMMISMIYVGFWLSLSITLSVRFRQAATSALTAIGIWLFFTVFYQIIINLIIRSFLPDPTFLTQDQVLRYNELILDLLRIAPNQLYTDASTTLLMPSVRSLGPMTMEQMAGAIPAPLPFRESLMIVWPQVSGLIGATVACFALAYYLFMRREIRS